MAGVPTIAGQRTAIAPGVLMVDTGERRAGCWWCAVRIGPEDGRPTSIARRVALATPFSACHWRGSSLASALDPPSFQEGAGGRFFVGRTVHHALPRAQLHRTHLPHPTHFFLCLYEPDAQARVFSSLFCLLVPCYRCLQQKHALPPPRLLGSRGSGLPAPNISPPQRRARP
jgi:hypothetical protein